MASAEEESSRGVNEDEEEMEDIELASSREASLPPRTSLATDPSENLDEPAPEIVEKVDHNGELSSPDGNPSTAEYQKPTAPSPSSEDSTIPTQLLRTTVIHSSNQTAEETFERLRTGLTNGSLHRSAVVDSVFNLLVGGAFDLESRFMIVDEANITRMVNFLQRQDEALQAEIWSVFVAVVRKSIRNVEMCCRVGLVSRVLDELEKTTELVADLLVQLLTILTHYSITVKETKRLLRSLRARDQCWSRNSLKLVEMMKELPRRNSCDVFFSFPGSPNAGIFLPPLSKFPYQNGWTFSCWLRMDPPNGVTFEKEQPYLYCFRTARGAELSCHIMGNCLVVSAEKAGKAAGRNALSKCVAAELKARKWQHVVLSHNYSRWGRCDVSCFIDGQLAETIDVNWSVAQSSEPWDRCCIGLSWPGSESLANTSFSGQMGAVYLLSEALSLAQANSLFCLGPGYQSAFKHQAESDLPEGYKKHLFDGRLHNSLVAVYSPKNCHGQLCLLSPPKNNANFFVQIAHAVMKDGVEVIKTHSIQSCLQSVGGVQMILPLFDQLDLPVQGGTPVDIDICSTILTVMTRLLESSHTFQQQLFHSKGFAVISYALHKSSTKHMSDSVVAGLTSLAKQLLVSSSGAPLLKQLFDYLLLNPKLWSLAEPSVQVHVYECLLTEVVGNAKLAAMVRRVPTVVELCHALKHIYFVAPPSAPSTWEVEPRHEGLSMQQIISIRAAILGIIQRLLLFNIQDTLDAQKCGGRDQEIHALFNLLATVHENDNLYDVLTLLTRLVAESPALLIPALDRDRGLGVIYSLFSSPSPLIRIPALKILGYFLARSTMKRKTESVHAWAALSLLAERLLIHAPFLCMPVYNVLFEILTEQMTPTFSYSTHVPPTAHYRFENPALLKVISQLICQSEETEELLKVKKTFLIDIISMCKDSRENRRTILQMSVWQEWLISLSHVFPSSEAHVEMSELVYDMFSMLLYHAIRFECGGWRVWVDTLAIAHSKVSWERFRVANEGRGGTANSTPEREREVAFTLEEVINKVVHSIEGSQENRSPRTDDESEKKEERPAPVYRTPEFCWSSIHLRLLRDLLSSIEGVVEEWRQSGDECGGVSEHVAASENQVVVANTVHVISQLADSLIMACGGLLPLLASATSPHSELAIVDACNQELPIDAAADLLSRFVSLADTFLFASSVSFAELEQEKNMPAGGILRESLRLIATSAVRGILSSRELPLDSSTDPAVSAKWLAIDSFVRSLRAARARDSSIKWEELLQEVDLQRIKAVVYRDMEETRHAQFLALSVVYLLSVLMVSRYRDILEPPSSPSPFFNSTNTTQEIRNTDDENQKEDAEAGKGNAESGAIEKSKTDEAREQNGDAMQDKPEGEGPETSAVVSSIHVHHASSIPTTLDSAPHEASELGRLSHQSGSPLAPVERRAQLSGKLVAALESTAPLLRDILSDFRSFFQKTLLGTHGQEIMNDSKVLETLRRKQGSVVELVMLLCSQEWQTSLQKHAGLAFIELVNEGRLMAHATRDHVLRVANEADFILNRLRAEDVSKHASFENETAEQLASRRAEEERLQRVICSCRRRDLLLASRILDRTISLLIAPGGAWNHGEAAPEQDGFWKLDVWEDDSRRRLRFVPNGMGSRHEDAAAQETVQDNGGENTELRIKQLAAGVAPTRALPSELVDESDMEKWANEADPPPSSQNTSYSTAAKLIAPGVIVPGTLSVTSTDLYFDADEDHPLYQQQDPQSLAYCEWLHGRWQLHEIRAIFLRRHLLQNTALELFLASRTAIMFALETHEDVRSVVSHLPRVGVGIKYGLPQSRKTSLLTPRQLFRHSDMTQRWQKREISNFDYLMFLNTVAGRTFNDLNQYPVFPWILTNYTDAHLDLSVASNFRDLSKPIGALSESRRKLFEQRFQSWDDATVPPFHYGTHYSTAAFTLNWLFRVEPFTSYFLNLQGGKFDCADRLFSSMAETWERCQRDSHDVKELIPELFYLPEMLRNSNDLRLGKRSDDRVVGDVLLPPWAKSPEHFIRIHRQALESDLVSCQLNQWIDLIFGYKQKGAEAVRATNVFHYLTYEGGVKLASISDPLEASAIQQQIASFGQTPCQLLTEAHPPRHSVMSISPLMFGRSEDELCMVMKFVSNSPVVFLAANTFSQLPSPTLLSISANLVFALNRWHNNYIGNSRGSGLAIADKEADTNSVSELPLTVDPLLAAAAPASFPPPRRHLGDSLQQGIAVSSSNFVSTPDSRAILSCGYPDYSFRVTDTETGAVRQVVYGHSDVVTVLARSETSLFSDCYMASGSVDCTVALWHFSGHLGRVVGEKEGGVDAGSAPEPRAILTGHDAPISALAVSAEHGLILSGCTDGALLLHTSVGDLLRRWDVRGGVEWLSLSRDCMSIALEGRGTLLLFSSSGRLLSSATSKDPLLCATLTRDGEYIVTGSESGVVTLWRLFPLQQLYSYRRADSSVRSLAVSASGRFVLAGLDSGAIVVLNADFARWHSTSTSHSSN